MNTSPTAAGLSSRTRRGGTLIAALTLPLSLMSAPAIAKGPTPPPTTTPTLTSTPATPTSKALAQAKKDNRRIEIESLRSESATYYANPDGKTLRLEQHLEPIRVKNASGSGFTPIDTTLVEADGVIKPKAAKGSLTLSAGGNTSAIKSKSGDIAAQIDAPQKLPKPTLKGNTATYSSTYGKGIDLVVTATATGFRQQIVIRERPAGPVTFRIPVELPKGISFGKNTQGQPTLKSADGKKSLDIRTAALLDAAAADANADLGAVRVGRAQVSLDGSALVYTPDPAFLAAPATTYPVTMAAVDDDWYECELGGDPCPAGDPMDTYINDVDLTDSWDMHYRDQMWVGKSYASNIAKRWRAYIQFPLPPASDPFWGSRIQNADLVLWNYLSNDCGLYVGSGITARRVTSDWDQLTLQWGDQPSVTNVGADTEYGAYSPDCAGSMNYEHDLIHSVNGIVQAWAGGEPNYGFQLRAGDESELRNWRRYRSREETSGYPAHGPRLAVDFEPAAPARQETVVIAVPEPLDTIPTDYNAAVALSTRSGTTPDEFNSIDVPDAVLDATLANRSAMADTVGTDRLTPDEAGVPEPDDTSGGDGEDVVAPRILSHKPAAEAVEVPLDAVVRVTFSEAVGLTEVKVQAPDGTAVAGSLANSNNDTVVTFTPDQPLAPGTKYSTEVSWATDTSENTTEPYTWSFRTVDQAAARWTFNEGVGRTAADSSGNGHTASLNETATWIAGKSGNAISNDPSQARIEASQVAAKQGQAIEVADETTASSVTYALPDGKSYRTDITTGPTRTRSGDGKWIPIDTTLRAQGGRFQPKALAEGMVVDISDGGTDPFVKMSADGKSYALRWPTPLPTPTVQGSVATYKDAAGTGADLVVTVLPAGFRHEVVLRERPAKPLELRIGVDDGVSLKQGKGGRLMLTGEKGKTWVSAAQPHAWDASATAQRPRAKKASVAADVVTKGGRTELVLKPDHAFLADSGTVYPVRLESTTQLPITGDVGLWSLDTPDFPASPSSPMTSAGTMTGNEKLRTYLRFDTAGLSGQTVTDAKLSLLNVDSSACGSAVGAGIQARRVTGTWDANNMHWANKPTATTEDAQLNTAGYGGTCADGYKRLEWNVTGMAQDWTGGAANHGLVLQSPTENNTNNWRHLTSSENTEFTNPIPTLTVTTSGPTSSPTVTALAITPAQDVAGTTVTSSLTPQLAATVADVIGGNLTGQFEIEHDPAATGQGTGQIWTGASAAVASGNQATVSVPGGKLNDGWKIRWRARAANASASTTSPWSTWQTATVDVPNPTIGTFQVTPSQVVNGVTVTTSLTPALRATVTDPAAQPVRAEFEVEHDPAATGQGSGQIWTGAVDGVVSGTQASATIPDGKLTDGWKVRWRARAINTATTVGSPWSDWQALSVDMPDPVSEPAVGALQVTPSQQVDGTTVTPTRTPALLAQVSDPAGKPLRAEAEIEHDPTTTGQGTGQVWTGSVDNVPAGTQASITVPADKLTDGWKVRWRARAVSPSAASAWSDWQSFTVILPKPTATGLTVTPSKVVDGVTVTTSVTPTLQATLTHPTGQALRAEAEIEHDPAATGQGTGQIWTGGGDGVASGTQTGITVPADKLTDGWKIRWRLRAVTDDAASAWSDWQQVTVDIVQPGEESLAQTAGPVIRTDQSFTTAAWLRWSDKDGDYVVAEQRGSHQAPFRLGNTADHGLAFTFTSSDATDATVEGVLSGVEAPVDEWFHLAGTYDSAARTATLYLNGAQAGTAQLSFPTWDAQAPLRIGAAMAGSMDEAVAYQRPLPAAGVTDLFMQAQAAEPPAAPSAKVGPAHRPASTTTSASSAAADDGSFYKRINLERCQTLDNNYNGDTADSYETWMKGKFAFGQSRIHESSYNYCWSSYIYVLEFAENPFTGGMQRSAKRSAQLKNAKRTNGQKVEIEDDDAFRFRATWVMHSYLGNTKGHEFSAPQLELSPQKFKIFTRLDQLAIVSGDNAVKVPSSDLSGMSMKIMADRGPQDKCQVITNESGPFGLRDVSAWHASSDALFVYGWPADITSGTQRCEIPVAVFIPGEDSGTGVAIPLWSRTLVDSRNIVEDNLVLRHGSGIPISPVDGKPYTQLVPKVQCDWEKAGFGKRQRKGGCINLGVSRVFVMSKSRNANFLEVIKHIEKALNPSVNAGTAPPKRPGHNWADPMHPPVRTSTVSPVSKVIPGNWARGGAALTKVNSDGGKYNRSFFQNIEFITDRGTADEKRWPDLPLAPDGTRPKPTSSQLIGVNHCKYYFWDEYKTATKWDYGVPRAGWLQCDEYPFASTKEGAGTKDGNYSLQAVPTNHNRDHGEALDSFYADYRVVTGDQFWVKIVS